MMLVSMARRLLLIAPKVALQAAELARLARRMHQGALPPREVAAALRATAEALLRLADDLHLPH